MILVRPVCYLYPRYDHDAWEVSNAVNDWQSSQGGQIIEGGYGQGKHWLFHPVSPTRFGILGRSFASLTIYLYRKDENYVGMWALYAGSLSRRIHPNIWSTGHHLLNGRLQSYTSLLELQQQRKVPIHCRCSESCDRDPRCGTRCRSRRARGPEPWPGRRRRRPRRRPARRVRR